MRRKNQTRKQKQKQGLSYEPQGVGYEPLGFANEPQGFGYEPQGFAEYRAKLYLERLAHAHLNCVGHLRIHLGSRVVAFIACTTLV